jgi:RNA recognition motif-containing protein
MLTLVKRTLRKSIA